jgi:hypothetical protein
MNPREGRGRVKASETVSAKLRRLLRGTEGMTSKELAALVGSTDDYVYHALRNVMVDAYIDRWECANTSPPVYRAVWCVVDVPEHCPHPLIERKAA